MHAFWANITLPIHLLRTCTCAILHLLALVGASFLTVGTGQQLAFTNLRCARPHLGPPHPHPPTDKALPATPSWQGAAAAGTEKQGADSKPNNSSGSKGPHTVVVFHPLRCLLNNAMPLPSETLTVCVAALLLPTSPSKTQRIDSRAAALANPKVPINQPRPHSFPRGPFKHSQCKPKSSSYVHQTGGTTWENASLRDGHSRIASGVFGLGPIHLYLQHPRATPALATTYR